MSAAHHAELHVTHCFLRISPPQRPILLHGHERSLTQIKYNRQGDLLFSVAKDNKPTGASGTGDTGRFCAAIRVMMRNGEEIYRKNR